MFASSAIFSRAGARGAEEDADCQNFTDVSMSSIKATVVSTLCSSLPDGEWSPPPAAVSQ
jgi:hypothetical protein